MNIGSDIHSWILVGKFVVLGLITLWIYVSGRKLYQAMSIQPDGDSGEKLKMSQIRRHIWGISLKLILLILATLALFVFFGKGTLTETTPASEEGRYKQLMEAPDMPTDEEIKLDADFLKPEVLKKQDQGFKAEAKEADDFVKRAIKEADSLNKR